MCFNSFQAIFFRIRYRYLCWTSTKSPIRQNIHAWISWFLLQVPLSLKLNKPCYPIRKKVNFRLSRSSKIYTLVRHRLNLNPKVTLIFHNIYRSSVVAGEKVIIVDDVLATGGTLNAAISLLESQGAVI